MTDFTASDILPFHLNLTHTTSVKPHLNKYKKVTSILYVFIHKTHKKLISFETKDGTCLVKRITIIIWCTWKPPVDIDTGIHYGTC